MKTSADYVSAALAVADAGPAEAPAAAPEAPAEIPTITPEPDAELDAAAAEGEEPVAAAPVAEVPVVKPAAVKPAPASKLDKSYEDLARKSEALRAQAEELKDARALLEAKGSKSAMRILAANGISWADAAREVLEGSGVKVPSKAEDAEAPSELAEKVTRLEAKLAAKEAAESRNQLLGELKHKIAEGGDKFKYTAARKSEAKAIQYIEGFYAEFGRLPGETLDETMEIALEAVEADLSAEAESWRPVLTASGQAVTAPASKTVVPAGAVRQQAPQTLTNGSGTGPQGSATTAPKQPKTAEDYIAAAMAAVTN